MNTRTLDKQVDEFVDDMHTSQPWEVKVKHLNGRNRILFELYLPGFANRIIHPSNISMVGKIEMIPINLTGNLKFNEIYYFCNDSDAEANLHTIEGDLSYINIIRGIKAVLEDFAKYSSPYPKRAIYLPKHPAAFGIAVQPYYVENPYASLVEPHMHALEHVFSKSAFRRQLDTDEILKSADMIIHSSYNSGLEELQVSQENFEMFLLNQSIERHMGLKD